MFLRLTLALGLLAGAFGAACDGSSIECEACSDGSHTGLNTLHGWPRFSMNGIADADISSYFTCPADEPGCDNADVTAAFGDDDDQAADDDGDNSDAWLDNMTTDCEEGEFCNYLQGIISFAVVMLVLGFAVILCSGCFCFSKWCCCCCKGGCCGKRYPTREYSNGDLNCARFVMLVFVGCTVGFVLAGFLKGADAFADAGYAVVDSPTGLMNAVRNVDVPLGNFIVSFGGSTLVTLFIDLNSTVTDAIDVRSANDQLLCINDALDTVRPIPSDIAGELELFNDALDLLPDLTPAVNDLNGLGDSVDTMQTALPTLSASLVQLNQSLVDLSDTSELRAEIATLNATLQTLGLYPDEITASLDELNATLPLESEVTTLNDDLAGLEADGTRTSSETVDTNEAYRTSLREQLVDLLDKAEALPDTGALSETLIELNDTLTDTQASVAATADLVDEFDASIQEIPSEDELNAQLQVIQDEIDSFNGTVLKDTLNQIDDAIDTLPDMDNLLEALDDMDVVRTIVPCVDLLLDELDGINATIMELPDEISDVEETMSELNETINDALDDIQDMDGDIVEMNTTINDLPDIDGYVQDITDIETDLADISSDLDIPGLQADVTALLGDADFNLTDISEQARELEATMADSSTRPSQAMIDNLLSFNETRTTLPAQIDALLIAFDIWTSGVCGSDGTVVCTCDTAADCNSSPFRGDSAQCPDAFDYCDMSGAALDSTYSTIDSVVVAVTAELNELEQNIADKPDDAAVRDGLSSLEDNIDSMPDLADTLGDLDELEQSMDDVPPLEDYISQMEDLQTTLDDIPDIDDLTSQLIDLNSTLADLPDLDDLIETLNDLDDDMPSEEDMADYLDYSEKLVETVYVNLDIWLSNMTSPVLQETWQTDGIRAMAERIVHTVDTMQQYWDEDAALLIDDMGDDLNVLDTLTDDAVAAEGPLHFFMTLAQEMEDEDEDEDDDDFYSGGDDDGNSWDEFIVSTGAGDRMEEDGNGVAYGDGKVCMTSFCMHNEIDYALSSESTGTADVNMLILSTYAIPLLICLLGMCSCLFRCGCCSTFMLFLIMASLPWIFWVAAIEVTPLIVGADLCTSGTSTTYQYLQFEQTTMCVDELGGDYDAAEAMCTLTVYEGDDDDSTSDDAIMDLDIAGVYADLFADCAGDGAVSNMLSSLASGVRVIPGDMVNTTIEDLDDVNLRDGVWDVLRDFSDSAGEDMANLIIDIDEVIGCDNLGTGMTMMIDAMCCEVGDALYWTTASWVMIGFSMMLCGCCAGVWGRKRFAKKPWGPIVKALQEAKEAKEDAGDFAASFGNGAAPPPLSPYNLSRFTKASTATGEETAGKSFEMHKRAEVSSI